MKRTIKIQASVQGVISTGSYQNLRPGYLIEETIEECDYDQDLIVAQTKDLYEKCYGLLREAEQKAIAERIQRERADLRFRLSPTSGKELPSVTSIINFDADFFVSAEDLTQYASQGQICHARVAEYIRSGKWVEPKTIDSIWTDIVIITKGSLKLSLDSGDFPAFLEKYPISDMKNGEVIYNEEHGYSGELDFIGIPKFKDALEIPTVFDVKRTVDKIKGGMQVAAYSKAKGIKQAILIPLNNKTDQGYSKPTVFNEQQLEGYWKMFLSKREEFKKRYSI
uniref:Uncharacterized protein n=1 Tax=viral metagenome TaxID=1070528 RepID=A0A6M3J4X9_9ZZZZ